MKGITNSSQIKFSPNLRSNHAFSNLTYDGVQLDCRNSHDDRLDEDKQNGMVFHHHLDRRKI